MRIKIISIILYSLFLVRFPGIALSNNEIVDVSGQRLDVDDLVIVVKDYCICLNDEAIKTESECNTWSKWKCYEKGYIGRMADYESKDNKLSVNAVWFYNPRIDCNGRIFSDEIGGAIYFGEECKEFCPNNYLLKLNKDEISKFMIENWTKEHWVDYLNRKKYVK